MAIKIQTFRRYLCCMRLKNLFTNCIFIISVKNSTLQLNFKAQLPVIKSRLINAKSQIQPIWRHLLPEDFLNPNFQQLCQDSAKLFLKTNCSNVLCYLVHLLVSSVFSFLQLYFWHYKVVNFIKIYLILDLVCINHYT